MDALQWRFFPAMPLLVQPEHYVGRTPPLQIAIFSSVLVFRDQRMYEVQGQDVTSKICIKQCFPKINMTKWDQKSNAVNWHLDSTWLFCRWGFVCCNLWKVDVTLAPRCCRKFSEEIVWNVLKFASEMEHAEPTYGQEPVSVSTFLRLKIKITELDLN